jgi:hypothetical protein
MPDSQFLSQAGAYQLALQRQTYLENAVMHLFQFPFVPTPASTLADLLAQEANFDGYATKTIATWPEIVAASGTAFLLYGAQQTFIWSHVNLDVGNMIAGHFIVSAAGDLVDVVTYDAALPMQGPFQSIAKTPAELCSN